MHGVRVEVEVGVGVTDGIIRQLRISKAKQPTKINRLNETDGFLIGLTQSFMIRFLPSLKKNISRGYLVISKRLLIVLNVFSPWCISTETV